MCRCVGVTVCRCDGVCDHTRLSSAFLSVSMRSKIKFPELKLKEACMTVENITSIIQMKTLAEDRLSL